MNPSTPIQMRTSAALAARHRSADAALARVHDALARIRRERAHLSVAAVARRAAVSRTFCYTNNKARTAISAALEQGGGQQRSETLAANDEERQGSWRERALNAEDALKTAHAEIGNQRARMGELLGQIRDAESEWTTESIQRITTENTALKQRVRQLTTDNRTLDERLKAARSNLRFQDRRVADLEARIADPRPAT